MESMFGRLRDGIGRFPEIVDYTSSVHGEAQFSAQQIRDRQVSNIIKYCAK